LHKILLKTEKQNQRRKVQSDVLQLICNSHARNEANLRKKNWTKINHKLRAVKLLSLHVTVAAVDKMNPDLS